MIRGMMNKAASESRQPFWQGCALTLFVLAVVLLIGPFIVALLLAILHPRNVEEIRRAKDDMKMLRVSLGHFRTEYNHWPDESSLAQSESIPVRVRSNLLQALLGTTRDNPRGIKFADFRRASLGISGLADEGETLALHDAWGTCYYLMADINGDSRIQNPEHFPDAIIEPKLQRRSPSFLPASSLLFSAGPDRDPRTWADNITSWR